ncbi:MAG: hypothetical protein IMW92_14305 [Bacillales bacterium]|nr:hypothetical protein [Bacillales bacterium]
MNKKLVIGFLITIIAVTSVSPAFAASDEISYNNLKVGNFVQSASLSKGESTIEIAVSNSKINPTQNSIVNAKPIEYSPQGKINLTFKIIKLALEKADPYLPNWLKKAVGYDTLAKLIIHYFELEGHVENAIYKAIRYVAPSWVPDIVVKGVTKTIMLFL